MVGSAYLQTPRVGGWGVGLTVFTVLRRTLPDLKGVLCDLAVLSTEFLEFEALLQVTASEGILLRGSITT